MASTTYSGQKIDGARIIGGTSWNPIVSPSNTQVYEICHEGKMSWVYIKNIEESGNLKRGDYISFYAENVEHDFKFDQRDYIPYYNTLYFTSKANRLISANDNGVVANIEGNKYDIEYINGVKYVKLIDVEDLFINKLKDESRTDYLYLPHVVYNDLIYVNYELLRSILVDSSKNVGSAHDKDVDSLFAESIQSCNLINYVADDNLYLRDDKICTGLYLNKSTTNNVRYEYISEICTDKSKNSVYINKSTYDLDNMRSIHVLRYNDLIYTKNSKNKCLIVNNIKLKLMDKLKIKSNDETNISAIVTLESSYGDLYNYKLTVGLNNYVRDIYFKYNMLNGALQIDESKINIYDNNIFDVLFPASIVDSDAAELFLEILSNKHAYSDIYYLDLIYLYAAMHTFNQNNYKQAIYYVDKYIKSQNSFQAYNKSIGHQIKAKIYSEKGDFVLARNELKLACKFGSKSACEYSKKQWFKLADIYLTIKQINHLRNDSRL